MKYSYNWLKEYVPQIPEPKNLVELLTMRAFEVEEVDMINKDAILDIKVLPNRTFDCLSHIGMAREIAAISNSKFQIPNLKLKEERALKVKDFLKVEVQDKKLCPRYSARVAIDVKVGESPQWIKDRLIACGLRPINNIVDITNYVMLEYGQPLHAFDLNKIAGRKIIVRRAKAGEKIITLDEGNFERKLSEKVLVIADSKKPLAIAGIKGGKWSEISAKTTQVALEAANFEPISTRQSSRTLHLRTDASIRFENGLDIDLTIQALDRAAELIQEIAKGQVVSGIADVLSIKPRQISTAVTHDYVESLLGIGIKTSEISAIFKRLNLPTHVHKNKSEIFYEISVPSWRNDLNTSEELIEEIGRLYSYEKIPVIMPTSLLVPAIKNEELINEERARNIMVGAGYAEVYNYSLVSEKDKELFGFDMAGPRYPLSNDQKYLRPTLIIRLLENIKENSKYFNKLKIFEIGKVFRRQAKSIEEKRMIAGAISGAGKGDTNLFYEAKGIIDLLLEKMGIPDFGYGEVKKVAGNKADMTQIFNRARNAMVEAEGKPIGWVGEINKNILEGVNMNINLPVAVFELDFDIINQLIEEEIEYQAPSKYPAIERDLSIVVPQNVKVDDALNIIENSSGPLVINIDLMDIYEGEHLENDMKSLTFKIVFQSYEKTLTDSEVNKIMEKIIGAVEGEGWEIRS